MSPIVKSLFALVRDSGGRIDTLRTHYDHDRAGRVVTLVAFMPGESGYTETALSQEVADYRDCAEAVLRASGLLDERDALRATVSRLNEALQEIAQYGGGDGGDWVGCCNIARDALASVPVVETKTSALQAKYRAALGRCVLAINTHMCSVTSCGRLDAAANAAEAVLAVVETGDTTP